MATFVIRETRDKLGRKRWRWNLLATNYEVVATSEQYNSYASALNGVHVVKATASDAAVENK